MTVLTLIKNPLPVPPTLVFEQLKISPSVYLIPVATIATVVTTLPETTMFAVAPLPVPPVNGTLMYVPLVYKLPPTKLVLSKSTITPDPWLISTSETLYGA